jgi:hypothetical protein
MNKKERARIEGIFTNRIDALVNVAGELALERITEKNKKFYDDEIEEIASLIDMLFYLKIEILGDDNESK